MTDFHTNSVRDFRRMKLCFKQTNKKMMPPKMLTPVCLRAKQHQDTWGMYCSSYPHLFSLQPCVDKIKPYTLC